MFEFAIARKYLLPKKKSLSASLIALLSVVVISLVVWLLLVFFSITEGIEKGWLSKLTILNGPIRLTPTAAYFSSYYHQIDQLASGSGYALKTIRQKAEGPTADPYDPEFDQELPLFFPQPDMDRNGRMIDPVQGAFRVLNSLALTYQDYTLSGAMLHVQMYRENIQQTLTQAAYVAALCDQNPHLQEVMLPLTDGDKERLAIHSVEENDLLQQDVYLPKSFQENGVRVGDPGYLGFSMQGAAAIQEQRIAIRVAGFYDPGIMAVGFKCILAPYAVVQTLAQMNRTFQLDPSSSNGIQVWVDDLARVRTIQASIQNALQAEGVDSYWKVITYHDYEFAKDLLQQFQSDRLLFLLVGIIILGVACCNIISLLVLLVNDKKKELGVLAAMGASRTSIAAIFAICGGSVGLISSCIGVLAALLTLQNIDAVSHFLSLLQGHEMFNAAFYGEVLPNRLSPNALYFTLIATPILSLLAGLVPAAVAARLQPSLILRGEI